MDYFKAIENFQWRERKATKNLSGDSQHFNGDSNLCSSEYENDITNKFEVTFDTR
jgi:hypothetical protein